jgi:excisionase family DNA binding protein
VQNQGNIFGKVKGEGVSMAEQGLSDIGHIAEHLGVKVNTVYSWVNQRKIPYVKVGRLIKFNMPYCVRHVRNVGNGLNGCIVDLQDINQWIAERKIAIKDF